VSSHSLIPASLSPNPQVMGLQPFYGKSLHWLLRAGSWVVHGLMTISGIPNRLNYCVSYMAYT